jgi:hypothetical protein
MYLSLYLYTCTSSVSQIYNMLPPAHQRGDGSRILSRIMFNISDISRLISNICNMNAFFSFDLFGFIYQNVSNSLELWNITPRYKILHTLNLGCSCITLRQPCNNQRPKSDIANHLYHGFPSKTIEREAKECNITARSLIIARLSGSNKTAAQI